MYVLVFLGALVPAWAGVKWIDQMTDSWQLASHPFVYDHIGVVDEKATTVGKKNQTILRDVQIDVANFAQRTAKADIKKWQQELAKTTLDQDQREYAEKQLSDAKDTYDAITAQLKTLKAPHGN